MNSADSDRAWQIAQWQIWAGWFTVTATLIARLTTVVLQLSRARIDAVDFGLALFKCSLLIAIVWFYPRHRWPAYLMLAVWPFGFVMAWTLAHAPPAVMVVGLLVGVGLLLGARGASRMYALRAAQRRSAPAV